MARNKKSCSVNTLKIALPNILWHANTLAIYLMSKCNCSPWIRR